MGTSVLCGKPGEHCECDQPRAAVGGRGRGSHGGRFLRAVQSLVGAVYLATATRLKGAPAGLPHRGGTLMSRVRAMRQECLHTKALERLTVVGTSTDEGLGLPSEARDGSPYVDWVERESSSAGVMLSTGWRGPSASTRTVSTQPPAGERAPAHQPVPPGPPRGRESLELLQVPQGTATRLGWECAVDNPLQLARAGVRLRRAQGAQPGRPQTTRPAPGRTNQVARSVQRAFHAGC